MDPDDDFYFKKVENAPLVEDTTITTYKSNMKKILKLTEAPSIHNLLLNPELYNDKLRKKIQSINTLITYYIAIITFMKSSGLKRSQKETYNKWYTYMMNERKKRNEKLSKNEPTDKQARTNYPWEQIIEHRDSLPKDSVEHLLIGMYTYIPPRRQKDYAKMRVYTDPNYEPKLDHTHFHTNHKRHGAYMYIKDFKTVKFMGPFFDKEMPKQLVEVIELSLKKEPREYLFMKCDKTPFDRVNAFTKFSNNILKREFKNEEMTVGALRHAHSTHTNNKAGLTFAERYRAAYKMGHSIKKDLVYAFNQDAPLVKLPQLPKTPEKDTKKNKKEKDYDICYRLNKETKQLEPFKCKAKK